MSGNPYVRERLTATRAGIPDPLVEVDCCLDRLRDLLDAGSGTAADAYDLLATWARLRRTRPELADQLGGAESLTRTDAWLADRGADLAQDALTIPNPQAWLDETAALETACEELGPPEDRSGLAERLLTDLDDAELVLYASRRFGVDDRELEADLARCHQWFSEHVELFLSASVHVQAVGMTFRPDLADCDYALAVTALKYLSVLDAAEAAEEELSLARVRPLELAAVQGLATRYRQERLVRVAQAAFLARIVTVLRDRMRHHPLAAAGEEAALEPLWWWTWRSPTGDMIARLTIPPQPEPDEQVHVEFVGPDRRRAADLAGQPVTLHGVEATIDPQGKASFPLVGLLETEEPLVLRVGAEQVAWTLIEVHAEDVALVVPP